MQTTTPHHHRLAWLDLLLHREILRLRARYQLSLDEFRGLYVSDRQVDELLREGYPDNADPTVQALLAERAEAALRGTDGSAVWERLVEATALSDTEQKLLLLALAPELDPKYETLYAYLNNDVTRKRPTHDLALRLFGDSEPERRRVRQALLPEGRLRTRALLRPPGAADEELAWLAQGMSLTPMAADYLQGLGAGTRLPPYARLREGGPDAGELPPALRRLPELLRTSPRHRPPWVLLQGVAGSGRRQVGDALANRLGVNLLEVDLTQALDDPRFSARLREILLQQCLAGALLMLRGAERLFGREGEPGDAARQLASELLRSDGRLCLLGEPGPDWGRLLPPERLLSFDLEPPGISQRERLWQAQLQNFGLSVDADSLRTLAERYQLSPGQIGEAAAWSAAMRRLQGGNGDGRLEGELLFEAARATSRARLGKRAVRVPPVSGWRDLVLPAAVLQQVEELATAIAHRHRVYGEWGLARHFGGAGGINVLFSGASGTGKTLTASVLAGDLGLDLFRIDLSGIVSKYIGETEKNLDEIFRAARASNAILFFDEADALFGKRSEVKDAHDRYANIEVAYLLQKMEEYDGVVILASNLSKNLDQAFSRRMHFVVEFPLPDETQRERLWRCLLPAELPLSDDVDLKFLARQFRLSGGEIRNIVLSAAFHAARDGSAVGMQSLLQATARQLIKQGKVPSANEFKHYFALLERPMR